MSTGREHEVSEDADLIEHKMTINQLVGYNMAQYRRAAGLTQAELGKRLGRWTKVAVSAAERSQDGIRVRKFDADELVTIARALGVPVIALFLPPEDDGIIWRYVLDGPGFPDLSTLLPHIMAGPIPDSPPMAAYRKRLIALGVGVVQDKLEHDARELQHQAIRSLAEQRVELERRVDDLRAFEREYRSRLLAYLEGQVRDLKRGATDSATFPSTVGA
jgi:transcriptional regulator with XRE-family HTH domain